MKRIVTVLLAAVTVCLFCSCKSSDYKKAAELYEQGSYEEAKAIFAELGDYKDSAEFVKKCDYTAAVGLLDEEKYEEAKAIFTELGDYEYSVEYIMKCDYSIAVGLFDAEKFGEAKNAFSALGDYEDCAMYVKKCDYHEADAMLEADEYEAAQKIFESLKGFEDSNQKVKECKWGRLYQYISTNGTPKTVSDKECHCLISDRKLDCQVEIRVFDDRSIQLYCHRDYVKLSNFDYVAFVISADIGVDNDVASFDYSYDQSLHFMNTNEKRTVDEEGNGTFNVHSISSAKDLKWKEFSGKEKALFATSESSYTNPSSAEIKNMSKELQTFDELMRQLLLSTGLDITLADLGFEAL